MDPKIPATFPKNLPSLSLNLPSLPQTPSIYRLRYLHATSITRLGAFRHPPKNLSKKKTESTMQLNLMKSKLPEATGKFQKLPSKSCIKSCSNLGALLQQSCGKPCSTLTTSLEANIAAFLQQPCNNLAAIILKQCRGRAGGQSCSKP
mgnify:CR=1 FL=1